MTSYFSLIPELFLPLLQLLIRKRSIGGTLVDLPIFLDN